MGDFALAIIDGTGDWSDGAYASSMRFSFCKQLERAGTTNYERGPSGEGYRVRERSTRAVRFLVASGKPRLMLAGYSRGGSAVVMAAAMLEAEGRTVDHLFLFDPVARHLSGSSDVIPGNVVNARVARRRIGAPEMDAYDHTLTVDKVGWAGRLAGHNPVRNWFGTTATAARAGVKVRSKVFLGSHGGLGGVGWPHVREDVACQANVAEFMNAGLRTAGIDLILLSKGLGRADS